MIHDAPASAYDANACGDPIGSARDDVRPDLARARFLGRVLVVPSQQDQSAPGERRRRRDLVHLRRSAANAAAVPPHAFQPSARATASRTRDALPPTHTGYPRPLTHVHCGHERRQARRDIAELDAERVVLGLDLAVARTERRR